LVYHDIYLMVKQVIRVKYGAMKTITD